MDLVRVAWTNKLTGEKGQGQAVTREMADNYLKTNSDTLPHLEFEIRDANKGAA